MELPRHCQQEPWLHEGGIHFLEEGKLAFISQSHEGNWEALVEGTYILLFSPTLQVVASRDLQSQVCASQHTGPQT